MLPLKKLTNFHATKFCGRKKCHLLQLMRCKAKHFIMEKGDFYFELNIEQLRNQPPFPARGPTNSSPCVWLCLWWWISDAVGLLLWWFGMTLAMLSARWVVATIGFPFMPISTFSMVDSSFFCIFLWFSSFCYFSFSFIFPWYTLVFIQYSSPIRDQ